MTTLHKTYKFPKSRIATNDVCAIGLQKHHIPAILEIDVTECREKIRQYKRTKGKISFTAWLIKVICSTIKDYEEVAAYLKGKRELIIFDDINVSVAVEKLINGSRVPIPLVVEKADKRSIESITEQIEDARNKVIAESDIVLQKKSNRFEAIYYHLPGFIRRSFWRYFISHPHFAYKKAGNIAFTSIGMMGKANGWFIPVSVHPACFGIGRIAKKAVAVNDEIKIREILNITVLLDHDIIDGAQMARFISALTDNIEKGKGL